MKPKKETVREVARNKYSEYVPRPIMATILPVLIISDSITCHLPHIAGVEIVTIPGLTSDSLLYNIMQETFTSFLNISHRSLVIVHVRTNDIWTSILKVSANASIHSLNHIVSAGPIAVFSSILPRPKDHKDTENARRYINNYIWSNTKNTPKVLTFRTYRDFLHNGSSPKESLYRMTYSNGNVDGIHLNRNGYTVLQQYFCRKISLTCKHYNITRPSIAKKKLLSRFDLPHVRRQSTCSVH